MNAHRVRQLTVLSILALAPLALGSQSDQCTLCTGTVYPAQEAGLPLLVQASELEIDSALERLSGLDEAGRSRSILIVDLSIDRDYPVDEVEQRLRRLSRDVAALDSLGTVGFRVPSDVGEFEGFVMRRMSIAMQAEAGISTFALSVEEMDSFLELAASPSAVSYFDVLVAPEALAEPLLEWIVENDPAKRLHLLSSPDSPNPLYDIAEAWAAGAVMSWLDSDSPLVHDAQRALNDLLASDYAVDTSASWEFLGASGERLSLPAISLVRSSDLRTVVIPRGTPDSAILAVSASDYAAPQILDATGIRPSSDSATRGSRLLVGVARGDLPHAVALDRTIALDPDVTRESIEITETRTIPVEEIVRDHQAYWDFQAGNEPRWIARNSTSLRFPVGPTGDLVEATIAGAQFFDTRNLSDWVWEDLFINGVRWKYGRIPELPLLQPEKVTELPLEINLSRDYQYRLVREDRVNGYDTWEIAFEPPANAPEGLPLYKGRVWIDKDTFARVAISSVQLNLNGGEVLSNEERVEYSPLDRTTHSFLTPAQTKETDPRSILWLPLSIEAQQSLSAAGRVVAVQRSTTLSALEIAPDRFAERLEEANRSRFRMVRDTEDGLRYLERTPSGERVVQTELDTSRIFVLGGLQHDEGLEYGVLPLAGVNYLNFDLFDRGLQANVFFAGVFTAANLTDPSVFGTRLNAGADFFALAIPFEQESFRNGIEIEEEAIEALPIGLTLRAGHPFADFGKIDLSLGITWVSFGAADTTSADFIVPRDTFVLSPTLDVRYDRWGTSLRTFVEYNTRTDWAMWGNPAEYSDDQKEFLKYGASISRSFHLPKFQRIGVGLEYVTGEDLDRFSKYELGFFGSNRVRGFPSGSVQAETAAFGHLSYGLVISEQFRLESFYDIALLDDETSGYRNEPFQGIGLAGQTLGPYGTILRLDVGKSIGSNARDGVVASIVILKILDR